MRAGTDPATPLPGVAKGAPSLAIVTLARDNPDEVRKTLSSVALQDNPPDLLLVVDGSDESNRERIRSICREFGATYWWDEPRGIYSAMQESLKQVHDFDYVWWVNSSDWLAGRQSISAVRAHLAAKEEIAQASDWVIGNLVRLKGSKFRLHDIQTPMSKFISDLKRGKTGFPHPSTVFRTRSLEAVGGYAKRFSVADDYYLSLRMADTFGPPTYISTVLSCHQVGGYTSKHLVRHFFEKSRARIAVGPWLTGFLELLRLPTLAIRQLVRQMRPAAIEPLRLPLDLSHYCSGTNASAWPLCCDKVIEAFSNAILDN